VLFISNSECKTNTTGNLRDLGTPQTEKLRVVAFSGAEMGVSQKDDRNGAESQFRL
jgi:hypothetical protein